MDQVAVHRPRNVDWKRAAALLYGDWGTSKAYVIGLAFVAAGFSSLSMILAVTVLTAVVAYNYAIVCRCFPDGGGVYSAARAQGKLLAVIGALLLVANFIVTAALSGWAAMSYFGVPPDLVGGCTIGVILLLGVINVFGPKHSGSLAVILAIPMVLVVLLIIVLSYPHLTTAHLEVSHQSFRANWVAFVGVILALSGVEAIASLTGVMKLDRGFTMENPRVKTTSAISLGVVALEVVVGTVLLGWAMLSLPPQSHNEILANKDTMLRFLGEQYGSMAWGPALGKWLGVIIGLVVGFLLLSAVNTAIVALIGLIYMMARDGEMPKALTHLNSHGVPRLPLLISILFPSLVVAITVVFTDPSQGLEVLADLYAIGVVGAIAVNLGSCSFNKKLDMALVNRWLMILTFFILVAIEITIAKTKPNALFFIVCILGSGLSLRGLMQKRAGLRTVVVTEEMAAAFAPETRERMQLKLQEGQRIMVAARGLTPVLRYAMEEARLRKGVLYVLYVKQLSVAMPATLMEQNRPRWQDDPDAAAIMSAVMELGKQNEVQVVPLYVVSENPALTIVDLSATLGSDILMLGASRRRFMSQLLHGDVTSEVARNLPEEIQLVIHG